MDVVGLGKIEVQVVVGVVGDAHIQSSVTIDLTLHKLNDC
jgi:hypothetical protein